MSEQKILFMYKASSVPQVILEQFKQLVPSGYSLSLCEAQTEAEQRRSLVAQADYLVSYGLGFDDFDVSEKAKIFQVLSAGFDRLDLEAFRSRGIPVANNGGANAPTVAEHAVLLTLSVLKKLPLHDATMQQQDWIGHREALSMRELRGKCVGIVGFGKIGQNVARIVRGFLATPVYYDVVPAAASVVAEFGIERLELDELLARSDIVSLHTPLTEQTRQLFDQQQFAKMKTGAVLINTARGEVVNEQALIDALDGGKLAGAGLDVFESEPLAPQSALRGRDNVVLTPHVAGTTIDTWTRRLEFAIANIQRVAAGELPEAVVN